jgi:hypothetical protein
MKTVTLIALGAILCSCMAKADNLPTCCNGLGEWEISGPPNWSTYTGSGGWDYPSSENPPVPWTIGFGYANPDVTWTVTVDGPKYAVQPDGSPSAWLIAEHLGFDDWYNAVYGGATEYSVGPGDVIEPVPGSSDAPEPSAIYLLTLGLTALVVGTRLDEQAPGRRETAQGTS